MNPFKYAQMMKYLTRVKKQKPDLPDVFPASQAPIPAKSDFVETKDAINRFVRANPRTEKAGGGMLVQPGFGGTRQGYAGDDGDYIYTRPSGAKRLVIGDTIYGSVRKGDKKGLEALKKKRDKLVASGKFNLRTKYDLEALKNEWRNTLPTKKATTWENFLKTKFPKDSTTPNSIRKKTETDLRKGESDFNPKEEYKINVKQKQNLKKVKQAMQLVKEHNDSDKFLYDKKTIYQKLGFVGGKPQIFKKEQSGAVYKSLFNEAIINEVEKLMPIEQKISNAFDKIKNENLKIYEPKGGNKEKKGGVLKRMISDIVSPKGGPTKYQISSRLITSVLNTHQPYLDIKNDFDYLEQNLARKMKGNTFNEAMDYAKYVRGGLEMKNIEKLSRNFLLPESTVMRFALRSAFNNYKAKNTDPSVKIFNLKADGTPGKPVDFGKLKIDYSTNMREIDINKIGFTYDGEFFTKNNIRTKGRESGLFDEVYKLTAKGNMPVPDPKNPNKNITLNKLLQLNKDKLTIGHNDAKGGITKLPFSDLRLEGGKINLALYNAYNKIQNKPLRKLIVNKLQGDFGFLKGDEYEQAFIEGERNKAINIAKKNITERTIYRQAGRDVIRDLGADLLKRKEPFQKELFRVAGIGQKESIQLLAGLSNNPKCKITYGKKKVAAEGGRIGYVTGSANLTECAKDGAKVFNDGKLNTADQIKDGARLLRGGRAVLSALSKYGVVPELAYVGLEAAGRTVLGEQPTNALLKSIDTLTFGATDFTSEIEAEKFGEYAKDKLAVDKFQNSQAKVRSILDRINKLEQINLQGGETDVTQEIATLKAQLQSASDELKANTVNPDMVQFITQRGDEIADAQLAKSPFAKKSLTDQLEGFPGVKDYMDTEATRVFPFQKTQQQLNEKVLPTPFILRAKTSDIINDIVPALRAQGVTVDGRPIGTKDVLNYQKQLREQPLSQVVEQGFNPESFYGASGTFSTPLPSGALDKKPNVIPEMEREIVGQTNVANPFDIDISDIGSGLRGFSAAGGGIAKQAGVSSGPPPESGPNSQGLQGLMKRVRNR